MTKTRIILFVVFVWINIVVGVLSAEESGKNLIPNSSFEEGFEVPSSWESKIDSGECEFKLETEGSEGKRCISIETLDNESSGRWESEYFQVEPGRDYLFSVKAKLRLQDENKLVYSHITSKEGDYIVAFQPVRINDTSWKVYRGKVIMIPEAVSKIRCRFSLLNNMEGQKVWIDEVKLTPLPRLNIKKENLVFSDSFNDITRWHVHTGQREDYNIVEDNGNKALEYKDPTLGIIEAEWIGRKSSDVRIKVKVKILEPVLLETKKTAGFGIYMIMDEYDQGLGMDAYNFIFNSFRDYNHIGIVDMYGQKGNTDYFFTSEYTNQVLGRDLELNQWHEIVFQKTGGLIKILVNEVPIVAWYDFEVLEKPVSKVRLRFWNTKGIYRIDNLEVVSLE